MSIPKKDPAVLLLEWARRVGSPGGGCHPEDVPALALALEDAVKALEMVARLQINSQVAYEQHAAKALATMAKRRKGKEL